MRLRTLQTGSHIKMSAAHSCIPGSGHQSSDPCLPLVITTAALVLTLFLPQHCVHSFVGHSLYHLPGEFALARPQALWCCGAQLMP